MADVGGERDWTVVQHQRCDECGLDASTVEEDGLARAVRAEGAAWRGALAGTGDLRARPGPEVWSPLEYACHVRDVFAVFSGRVERMVAEDEPELGWWDHEAAVTEERYNDQDPAAVADALAANAAAFAAALARVPAGGWDRAGTRRGGERFTVAGLARFALHESHHHRQDATGVRIAGGDDAGVVGRVLAEGFADDPVMSWLLGGVGRVDKLLPFFGFIARESAIPMGASWLTADGAGAACWTPPGQGDWPDERGARFLELLQGFCDADDFRRLVEMNAVMDANHPTEPHWYLATIAAMPAARGRGIGTALLTAGLAAVDREGLPAYLESSNPRNVTLYERHGFEVTDTVYLPDGPPLILMWRTAR